MLTLKLTKLVVIYIMSHNIYTQVPAQGDQRAIVTVERSAGNRHCVWTFKCLISANPSTCGGGSQRKP